MENTQYKRNIGCFLYPGTNTKIQKKLTKKLKNLTNPKKLKNFKKPKKIKKLQKLKKNTKSNKTIKKYTKP